jgi:hypothetical protein
LYRFAGRFVHFVVASLGVNLSRISLGELVATGFDVYILLMHVFEKTTLWRKGFGLSDNDDDARVMLRDRLLNIRERAGQLVSIIVRDMPGVTVHDLSHLDALWETASLIAGDNYPINPAEAFVFGVAVLLHDAAMSVAAYPEGMVAIQQTPQWRDAVASLIQAECGAMPTASQLAEPPDHIVRAALPEVLRQLHAVQAEQLGTIAWPLPGGGKQFLIQDDGLRDAYGSIIGKIAASHWWSATELRGRMRPLRVNAGPGVPSQWIVDPIKLACLLRVADAAHIDHRRAPHFLRALLRPSGVSDVHWTFQNKLGKPSIDKNFVVYTGGPFKVEDAEAWWLCYDMLGAVDEELRSVQAVLDVHGVPQFIISGVKGAKSPESVADFITTEGWRPVNAELHVSNVPALVALLGGERLYGSNVTVALRELIQNSADSIRAMRLLVTQSEVGGIIRVRLRKEALGEWWLDVEDDGVGMSPVVLTGALLDFGRSFWRSPTIRQEFPGLLAKGLQPTGRYGIGFFAVFMLGDRVTVTSRRYDAATSDTHTLDFRGGLQSRPILREPAQNEALQASGTRVSVRLRVAPDEPKGLLYRGSAGNTKLLTPLEHVVARLAPALDVSIEAEEAVGERVSAIVANDWISTQPAIVCQRANRGYDSVTNFEQIGSTMSELRDESTGVLYGRACINPLDSFFARAGVVTVGGLRASDVGCIAGILLGEEQTVSRDSAMPTVPAIVLRRWATEQAALLASSKLPGSGKLRAAAIVMMLGGEIGNLPIAIRDGEYLTSLDLIEYLSGLNAVQVFYGDSVEHDDVVDDDVARRDFERCFELSKTLILVPKSPPTLLKIGELNWPECLPDLYIDERPQTCTDSFASALARAWGVSPEHYYDEQLPVGEVNGTDIVREVRVYQRQEAVDEQEAE